MHAVVHHRRRIDAAREENPEFLRGMGTAVLLGSGCWLLLFVLI